MTYRNGASQQGKGLHFHHKELKKIMREHYRKHGREGYMVLMDLKQFFPSAPHAAIYERHRRLILDPEIRAVADMVVASVPGGVGMPLGVEPSQMEMVSLPSAVDNWDRLPTAGGGSGPLHGRLPHGSGNQRAGGGDPGRRDPSAWRPWG